MERLGGAHVDDMARRIEHNDATQRRLDRSIAHDLRTKEQVRLTFRVVDREGLRRRTLFGDELHRLSRHDRSRAALVEVDRFAGVGSLGHRHETARHGEGRTTMERRGGHVAGAGGHGERSGWRSGLHWLCG